MPRLRLLAQQSTQPSQLVATKGMHARRSIFYSPHVEHAAFEINLVPTESAQLGYAETVPICDEDHRGVTMTVVCTDNLIRID